YEALELNCKFETTKDGMLPRTTNLKLYEISFGAAKGIYNEQFRSDLRNHRYLVQHLMPLLLILDALKIEDLKERYIDILIKTLEHRDKFIIGYTSIFNITGFSSYEVRLLKEFSQKLNKMTFVGDHYKWL